MEFFVIVSVIVPFTNTEINFTRKFSLVVESMTASLRTNLKRILIFIGIMETNQFQNAEYPAGG